VESFTGNCLTCVQVGRGSVPGGCERFVYDLSSMAERDMVRPILVMTFCLRLLGVSGAS